ncbi:cyclomaltodextrinase N-terminal domain-containing protein [Alteromonas sp. SM 2104]|nr:cyclomaltodextrinase N-terminal domain-containing protein [Alteromonas oceanisediminis]
MAPVHAGDNKNVGTASVQVSPPHWWAGMKSQQLQLMLHGDNIAQYTPSLTSAQVHIENVSRTDNPNYLFIHLRLPERAEPEAFEIILNGEDDKKTVHYNLAQRRQNSAMREGFSAKDAIYLITPDRFANGDIQNDTVEGYADPVDRNNKGGRHGGDIQGIINHLDYLHDMGFTQIWTMPLLENAMDAYSYHGYSTTDYFQIDPRFGTNALYQQLSHQARERGIGVIKDVVLNHIGSEHVWMDDMPSADWINHGRKFVPTSHRREALHDPHAVEADIEGFASGWFVPTMPDLNQRNPLLATYLIQYAIWWIEFADLSGLRVDTYSYSDKEFLSEWTSRIMAEYPNLNIVGEEWTTNPAITAYWQRGSMRHDDYSSELPSVMDFPLQVALYEALTEEETWATGLRKLYETFASDFLYGDPYNLVVFADNHDMSRVMTQFDDDQALMKMAMSVILTTRGIPQVFYGTEIGMSHPGTDDHGLLRADFPGGWPGDAVNAFTQQGLSPQQRQLQAYFKALLNFRRSSPAITHGEMTHYAPNDGVYVYFRHEGDDIVMVALNKNAQEVALPTARFEQFLSQKSILNNVLKNEQQPIGDHVLLDAKSTQIFTLQ